MSQGYIPTPAPAFPRAPAADSAGTSGPAGTSDPVKSYKVTWLLSLFLGAFGADRFYLGKIGTGIAKLVTVGGAGVWALMDLLLILAGLVRDGQGRLLLGMHEMRLRASVISGAVFAGRLVLIVVMALTVPWASLWSPCSAAPVAAESEETEDPGAEPDGDPEAPVGEEGARAWAAETFGTFDAREIVGSDKQTVELEEEYRVPFMLTIEIRTGSTIAMRTYDADGETMTIAGTEGPPGTTYTFMQGDAEAVHSMEITGNGDWSVTMAPIDSLPMLPPNGVGNGDFLYGGAGGECAMVVGEPEDEDSGIPYTSVHEKRTADLRNYTGLGDVTTAFSRTELRDLQPGPSVITVNSQHEWDLDCG